MLRGGQQKNFARCARYFFLLPPSKIFLSPSPENFFCPPPLKIPVSAPVYGLHLCLLQVATVYYPNEFLSLEHEKFTSWINIGVGIYTVVLLLLEYALIGSICFYNHVSFTLHKLAKVKSPPKQDNAFQSFYNVYFMLMAIISMVTYLIPKTHSLIKKWKSKPPKVDLKSLIVNKSQNVSRIISQEETTNSSDVGKSNSETNNELLSPAKRQNELTLNVAHLREEGDIESYGQQSSSSSLASKRFATPQITTIESPVTEENTMMAPPAKESANTAESVVINVSQIQATSSTSASRSSSAQTPSVVRKQSRDEVSSRVASGK